MSLRASVRAWLIPACLALCGCTVQTGLPGPNVMINTPGGGLVPLNAPGPVMPGGPVSPPPGLEPMSPAAAQTVSRDGIYAGSMEALSTAGGICANQVKVNGFKVHGNSVRFGDFRGTIDPDGGLQMVFRGNWIIGEFAGASFHGHVQGAGVGQPGCTFILTLNRTGP